MARIATYTLRIEADKTWHLDESEREALQAGIQDAEDAVNDRLPEGFYCKIDEAREEGK